MEPTRIREYATVLREMDLTALEVHANGTIRLERMGTVPAGAAPAAPLPTVVQPAAEPETADHAEGTIITSPMVGVFYIAPAENAEPYVRVGSVVQKGDILCIIEAMKLMNEIPAEIDGVITEVLAVNGALVEFGQPLFRIRREQE